MSSEQPTREKPPPQIPTDMNAFNRKLIEEFRANRGQLSGQMAGRTLILLGERSSGWSREQRLLASLNLACILIFRDR